MGFRHGTRRKSVHEPAEVVHASIQAISQIPTTAGAWIQLCCLAMVLAGTLQLTVVLHLLKLPVMSQRAQCVK